MPDSDFDRLLEAFRVANARFIREVHNVWNHGSTNPHLFSAEFTAADLGLDVQPS